MNAAEHGPTVDPSPSAGGDGVRPHGDAAAPVDGSSRDAVDRLWHARSVAVVGASDRAGALGRLPVEHLQRYGYTGAIYPVRPDGAPVAGLRSYASVQACPGQVELAMIMVGAGRVLAAVDDCVAAGVRTAVVCASGFAETGRRGAVLQREVASRAAAGGLRLVGPNCIGTVGVGAGLVASFSPLFAGASTTLVPGTIGFVSQSGALGYGAVSLAFERGLGLGWVATTGNEADLTALEVLDAIAQDPACTGLLAVVERLDDVGTLARLAARGVPVAMLKGGTSRAGQQAAASHTGALATEDRVVDAALRQLGIVRARDVEELLDLGEVFAQPRRPAGPRVAVITTSGGSGILAADAIEDIGLVLARLHDETRAALAAIVPAYGSTANPVDVTASVMSDPTLVERALSVLVDDDGVDAVVACFCVLTAGDVDVVVESLARAAERSGKPVVVARTGAAHLAPDAAAALRAAGIATFPTPSRAVRALAGLVQTSTPSHETFVVPSAGTHGARRTGAVGRREADRVAGGLGAGGRRSGDRSAGDPGATVGRAVRPGAGERGAGPTPRGPLSADEPAVKDALAADEIAVPEGRLVESPADAAAAVVDLGGRAVLKAVVPGLLHKTEAGGVVVGVSADEAAATYARLARLGGGVLVEEIVDGGVEALVGIAQSPLGPVLTVGVGGTLTELLDDVALRLLPAQPPDDWEDQVDAMIGETRLGRLLDGTRGAGPYDRAALVELVVALTHAVAHWPPGFELDLNPVAVLPHGRGAVVLDAAYVPGLGQ